METKKHLQSHHKYHQQIHQHMSSGKEKKISAKKEIQLIQALFKNGLYVQRELNQACQQAGLNANQFSILNEIISTGPLSQKKLCERLLFEKSNVSKIIKLLLNQKLINVMQPPEDRRLTLLVETQEGLERWKICMHHFSHSSTGLLSCLPQSDALTLFEILKKLEEGYRTKDGS